VPPDTSTEAEPSDVFSVEAGVEEVVITIAGGSETVTTLVVVQELKLSVTVKV